MSSLAAGTSVSLADQSYGANATNATLIRCARTTVISPGRPVCAIPAAWIARTVCCCPAGPKSNEWLLASFSTVKPACL